MLGNVLGFCLKQGILLDAHNSHFFKQKCSSCGSIEPLKIESKPKTTK